jgi:hypothetical protein
LYADLSSERIRHAPFGIAPWNLVLEIVGDRGRLMMTGGGPSQVRQVSFTEATEEFHLLAASPACDYQIESFADDSIGIRAAGKYVGADIRGSVSNNIDWCREWERFLVNMPNPYNPCFILDLELAEEFDREASQAVCRWGVRERAATGLCLEKRGRPDIFAWCGRTRSRGWPFCAKVLGSATATAGLSRSSSRRLFRPAISCR